MVFRDRTEAGQTVARKLDAYRGRDDVTVLGLPRGGVPVAFEVARYLHAPLDVFLVRKLGAPGREELAMGAIASGGVRVMNEDVVRKYHIAQSAIDHAAAREQSELERRERAYREGRHALDVACRIAILVDDGLATGATMHAAVAALRKLAPSRIVVAVPVAAPATRDEFRGEVEEIVCAEMPDPFHAVGLWYDNFPQTTDEEVRNLLCRHAD